MHEKKLHLESDLEKQKSYFTRNMHVFCRALSKTSTFFEISAIYAF